VLKVAGADISKLGFMEQVDLLKRSVGSLPDVTYCIAPPLGHSLSANGGLEDVSLVKKYEISEDDYNKRENNFRKWRQDKKAADPTWSLAKEIKMNQDKKRMEKDPNFVPEPFEAKAPITDDDHLAEEAAKMKIGDRCEVALGGKRGEIKFVGKIPQIAAGWFVGVQYDEPVGKNDGTCKGKRYFECPPKYGGFLRPDKLQVGDFPELDIFDESDEDADDEGEGNSAAAPAAAEPQPVS